MSKKRQGPLLDPQGIRSAQLTTLSKDYADGHVIPSHFHPEAQLVFASEGVMTIHTRQGIWVVPPLRAVWIPCKEIHSIEMSGTVKMRTLYLSPRTATRLPEHCFVLNVSPLFRELILHACGRTAWRSRNPQDKRVLEFLLDQFKSAPTVPLQLPQPKDPRARRVAERLIRDPSDPSPLAALCKAAGGSKRTIERAFLSETGITFGKWRQQLRLMHGMKLLASGEKVTHAALESGYDSPSAFISVFKKALGQSPARYFNNGGVIRKPVV